MKINTAPRRPPTKGETDDLVVNSSRIYDDRIKTLTREVADLRRERRLTLRQLRGSWWSRFKRWVRRV
ncbi:MAG: hypothetical protein ACI9MR_000024 [Myxococcota bacterium]|jgi:hypothetical protein